MTTALLKSCLEDLIEEDILPPCFNDTSLGIGMGGNISNISIDQSMCQPQLKKAYQLSTAPDLTKLRMKITFDEDSNNSHSSDIVDCSFDMSMDV